MSDASPRLTDDGQMCGCGHVHPARIEDERLAELKADAARLEDHRDLLGDLAWYRDTYTALTELQSLRAAVKRVEEIHRHETDYRLGDRTPLCTEDFEPLPCPTIRALRGEE